MEKVHRTVKTVQRGSGLTVARQTIICNNVSSNILRNVKNVPIAKISFFFKFWPSLIIIIIIIIITQLLTRHMSA